MRPLIPGDPAAIGPYRLIARLGAGGTGLVHLGRSETGRTVAVKVVRSEHARHPDFRRRFAREVAAARRVGGEWTAAVLDAGTEAPVPWVATRYIAGPDLTTVVARDFGPLPEHSVRVLAHRPASCRRNRSAVSNSPPPTTCSASAPSWCTRPPAGSSSAPRRPGSTRASSGSRRRRRT
ncbi:hypothetical protein ADL06_21540 [Streptomyces sp. NRRL F-6491]|nr:hypothetical protein ADL06_21540 [Streptomyces sp. NRRL F-6491]KOX43365.1 hypothetical protein ADL08_15080 [Streptomyces sp. NRRL F-6492]